VLREGRRAVVGLDQVARFFLGQVEGLRDDPAKQSGAAGFGAEGAIGYSRGETSEPVHDPQLETASPWVAPWPQSGRGDGDNRPRAAELRQLERGPAADRVSRSVSRDDAEFVQKAGERDGVPGRCVVAVVRRRIRFAVARQIDRDHIVVSGELRSDRGPVSSRAAGSVKEQQWLAVPAAFVGDPRGLHRHLSALIELRFNIYIA
jgi:hypothetical protein